ncbi:MAG: hypothetical protein R2699_00225 [Acidimicrobiales bacterium]
MYGQSTNGVGTGVYGQGFYGVRAQTTTGVAVQAISHQTRTCSSSGRRRSRPPERWRSAGEVVYDQNGDLWMYRAGNAGHVATARRPGDGRVAGPAERTEARLRRATVRAGDRTEVADHGRTGSGARHEEQRLRRPERGVGVLTTDRGQRVLQWQGS